MKIDLKVVATMFVKVELEDFLEEDEALDGADDEESTIVSEDDLLGRYREQIDDGDMPLDDVLEQSTSYDIAVVRESSESEAPDWRTKVPASSAEFVQSIVDQIPETLGARERFVEILNTIAKG